MNQFRLILLAFLVYSPCAFAGDTNAPAADKSFKIGATEAVKFYDKSMTVTGKVAQVTERPAVTFINLDEAFPSSPFTGVILASNKNGFSGISQLRDKNVEITGIIKKYHDKAEIVLTNASQLKILEPKKK